MVSGHRDVALAEAHETLIKTLADMHDFYNWVQENMPAMLHQWAEVKAAKAKEDGTLR